MLRRNLHLTPKQQRRNLELDQINRRRWGQDKGRTEREAYTSFMQINRTTRIVYLKM